MSLSKKILLSLVSLLLLVGIGCWIFISFFFDDVLNDTLIPKLNAAVLTASHGNYSLKIGRIYQSGTSIFCKNVELIRVAYDSSETGLTIRKLTSDTVRLTNVNELDLLQGKGLNVGKMDFRSPKLYMVEVGEGRNRLQTEPLTKNSGSKSMPNGLPVISIGNIILDDVAIYMADSLDHEDLPTYTNAQILLSSLLLDSTNLKNQPLLYSRHVECSLPQALYPLPGSDYVLQVRNLHVNFTDSLMTIDSFAYRPDFSDEGLNTKSKSVRSRMNFDCTNLRIEGMDFVRFLAGKKISFHKCLAESWDVDYYTDERKPQRVSTSRSVIPNEILQSFPLAVDIDSLVLENGSLKMTQWEKENVKAGVVTMDHIKIIAYPFCLDSSNPLCDKPTNIVVTALFLGEAPVKARITYPFQSKDLDFTIEASMGGLSLKKLNTFLIPNERKEIVGGVVESGDLRMDVRKGVATTTITPRYHDLSMRILAENPKSKRGILEGLKTFVANTFILRSNNVDKDGQKAKTATTSRRWAKKEEFLEFVWKSLRKSLGAIIGGFE